MHVEKNDLEAKFCLWPDVRVAYSDGYEARVLQELLEMVETNRDRIERARNEFFASRASRVRFDADRLWAELNDGRVPGVPLAWFPRLLHASASERKQVRA